MSDEKLDNESKERALVGYVIATASLAGQICCELTVADHGIDAEIEFKLPDGRAAAKRIYLQLKSGDTYLYHRERDDKDIFTIKKPDHVRYWMDHDSHVMLVHRNSEGVIRWMEIRDWLRKATNNGRNPVKQIEFEAERFDAMSVRRWRDKVLGK
ncbi:MAG: DUF4365 domain-containing protein [Acidobacteria bacterium]|nr:DUF4365 domain-containing protein [Acidobacteriota bacterium]